MQRMFWTTGELLAHGRSRRWIDEEVRAGRLMVARKGHLHLPSADPDVVRAVRVGGVATGATAARALKIWAPEDELLSVAVPATASRLRHPDDPSAPLGNAPVRVHWIGESLPPVSALTRIAPILLVLEHVLLTFAPEFAIGLVDSASHHRRIRAADLAALRERLPGPLVAVVRRADGRCESGIESAARYLLELAGVRVVPQVEIPGVGRVDLLLEGRLIVELDGREWHGERFAVDRARDAAAARAGYRTLRFTYQQVMDDWPGVMSAILTALAT
jgi:very-short-patch-repair endonuclease